MSERIHVVPHGSGWATRREGRNSPVSSTHNASRCDTGTARGTAVHPNAAEVIIHRPDGRIRDANSYGNDPLSAEG